MKLTIFTLITLISYSTLAFKLTPMSSSIIAQDKTTSILSLYNEGKEPIAIEISMAHREMDKNGKEKHPSADGLFAVYPNQLILNAKQKRSIKVQWLGEKNIKTEKSFRLIAEQLPINVSNEKRKGIKILLRYIAAIYITPKDGASKIESKLITQKEDKIKIEVQNHGNIHQVLKEAKLKVKTDKWQTFEKDALKGLAGENILAKSKREFTIKLPNSEKVKEVKIDYND